MHTLFIIIFLIGAYLLGSVSSAILVSRFFSLPDPREEGSKNPGATNVLRLSGKKYAALVLVADVLKGFLPVLIAMLFGASFTVLGFICLAAVLGHIFPIFFGFQGGKGVATAIGALLGIHFLMGVAVIATWLLVVYVFRYSSLASIISMALAPFYATIAVSSLTIFPPLFFTTLVILMKHKDNITRLMDGEEKKIKLTSSLSETLYQTQKNEESNQK